MKYHVLGCVLGRSLRLPRVCVCVCVCMCVRARVNVCLFTHAFQKVAGHWSVWEGKCWFIFIIFLFSHHMAGRCWETSCLQKTGKYYPTFILFPLRPKHTTSNKQHNAAEHDQTSIKRTHGNSDNTSQSTTQHQGIHMMYGAFGLFWLISFFYLLQEPDCSNASSSRFSVTRDRRSKSLDRRGSDPTSTVRAEIRLDFVP